MNRITNYKKLQDDIVQWIRDYALANNIQSLVVGVSGGIDSAVVSTLCAMTSLPTNCCILDIYSDPTHIEIARNHVYTIHDRYKGDDGGNNVFIGIKSLVTAFEAFHDNNAYSNHTLANTKSRVRMTYLHQIASHLNGIVVGTGNKVEDFGVGFFTKYGDGGVDISPIADLYKSEVRELGQYMGIAQEILDAAPTDGLWSDGRTDEDQIGCSYELLEWCMEYGNSVEEYTDEQLAAMKIYKNLNNKNQHKMLPIPIYKLQLDDTTA